MGERNRNKSVLIARRYRLGPLSEKKTAALYARQSSYIFMILL